MDTIFVDRTYFTSDDGYHNFLVFYSTIFSSLKFDNNYKNVTNCISARISAEKNEFVWF